jgi:hypothetical protein
MKSSAREHTWHFKDKKALLLQAGSALAPRQGTKLAKDVLQRARDAL